ncbi:MAG: hypothetical protein WD575_04770 [Nitriliruptoraceae bacterium]
MTDRSGPDEGPASSRDGFAEDLETLGFTRSGTSRRDGDVWAVAFNRHLTFFVHEDDDERVLLTWAFGLGEYVEERGWRMSVTDVSTAEVYPRSDVRVPRDITQVRGEMSRVLASLRLDLGAPDL